MLSVAARGAYAPQVWVSYKRSWPHWTRGTWLFGIVLTSDAATTSLQEMKCKHWNIIDVYTAVYMSLTKCVCGILTLWICMWRKINYKLYISVQTNLYMISTPFNLFRPLPLARVRQPLARFSILTRVPLQTSNLWSLRTLAQIIAGCLTSPMRVHPLGLVGGFGLRQRALFSSCHKGLFTMMYQQNSKAFQSCGFAV